MLLTQHYMLFIQFKLHPIWILDALLYCSAALTISVYPDVDYDIVIHIFSIRYRSHYYIVVTTWSLLYCRYSHMTRMFCMTNEAGGVNANVTPVGVGLMKT